MSTSSRRTWLITGADKGLGYSTAKAALERGDQVVVTVLNGDGTHGLSSSYPETLRVHEAEQEVRGLACLRRCTHDGTIVFAQDFQPRADVIGVANGRHDPERSAAKRGGKLSH